MHRLAFLKEVFAGILFVPPHLTQIAPFVRSHLDTKRYMYLVIVALWPIYAVATYNAGLQWHLALGLPTAFWAVFGHGLLIVLPILLVTYIVGFFWEALFAGIRKQPMNEGLFVTCALFPLILPVTLPLWQVAAGISFGIVIGKEVFGGTGRNFLNPALTGRAFLMLAYANKMDGDVWVYGTSGIDAISQATPLADPGAFSLNQLFWGFYPDCLGSSFTGLIILGGLFLVFIGIADWRIILGGLIGAVITAWVFGVSPLQQLMAGGLLFGLTFMATDPVSAPVLNLARFIYGVLIGVAIILARMLNSSDSVTFAILFMNCVAPLMDEIGLKLRLRRRNAKWRM